MISELNGKLIAEKYRIDELIGETSFGALYRGMNTLLEKTVAIAVPTSDDDGLFLTQARIAARVSHPNVLNLTDFGSDTDGLSFAVFESLTGETLTEAIKREGQLPTEMAIDIAKQTGAALSAAHAGAFIHGDLTPSDVIVASSEPGRVSVKVFGFGSRAAIESTGEGENGRDPSRFAYLAPERCSGSEEPDGRGDIYSLGVILYEMLAGSVPFTGETAGEVMLRQIDEPPPPLSSFRQDLPAWIEPVILKAMAKDPDARYQFVDQFVTDLSSASVGSSDPLSAANGANNIWKTAFVVLAGISLLTVGLIYLTYSRRTDPATALQPDANGMPVQPINPATGVEEQNLSNLPPDYTMLDANSNTAIPPGTVPGDGSNPWLNGTAPPPGAPSIPPGGQIIQVPQGQSPFMMDPNCVLQPSGIYLCPVPITPTPTPRISPTPRTPANANSNTGTAPAVTPTPQQARPSPTPQRTPAQPARTPASNDPDPNGQ